MDLGSLREKLEAKRIGKECGILRRLEIYSLIGLISKAHRRKRQKE